MHLFLYGKSGVGKSTLIREVLRECGVRPRGFFTRKITRESGTFLFLNEANEAAYEESTCVARYLPEGIKVENEAFSRLALAALSGIEPGSTVLMDELGMLERGAIPFRERVRELFAFPCRIVGVVKEHGDEYLEELKQCENVRLLELTETNREEVKRALLRHLSPVRLSDALEIPPGMTSLVGGGGKTSLMMRLAGELSESAPCIVTTTTHIAVPTECETLLNPTEAEVRRALAYSPFLCVAGREESTGKLVMPNESLMQALPSLAKYVLIEADGAKRLPLKAPAEHEPVLLANTRRVIAVAGADGVGKRIEEACFRPERYVALVHKTPQDVVSPEDAAAVLQSPNGQKKGVAVPFSVVLNKADSTERFSSAREIAKHIQGTVLVAGLRHTSPVFELWRNGICLW